ncbi:MAG: S8 family serine peptidase, partial [Lachnospiraceae bacterium]|nr:S8 family serine peptidase [Lachnospiraceae bacterium]
MEDQKIENLLNLALDATKEEIEKSEELEAGYNQRERTWEVIAHYSGNFADIQALLPELQNAVILSGGYAILTGTRNQIEALAALPQIEYVEKPRRLYFSVSIGRTASCVYPVQAAPFELFGEGVLVAVIDSGVDYFHPDFRKEDGSTRIRAIWDQSARLPETADGSSLPSGKEAGGVDGAIEETVDSGVAPLGHVPAGFTRGLEYTQADINAALATGSRETGLALVPEQDLSGHGTEVLGIAAGNGRASGNPYRGIAPKSDILVVKLGTPLPGGFPSTTELMQAIEYVVRKAEEFREPLVINLSFGNVYGSHRGRSLLETYIDAMAMRGRTVIIAGTGNEGNTGGHVAGKLFTGNDIVSGGTDSEADNIVSSGMVVSSGNTVSGGTGALVSTIREIEFLISDFETTMNLQIWKNYADEFDIILVHPNGRSAGPFGEEIGTVRYRLGFTSLLVYYGEPSPYQAEQEIYIDLIPEGEYIDSGIW